MNAPSTPTGQTETWTAIGAAAAAAIALAKKILGRKQSPKPDHITRAEFHHRLDTLHSALSTLHSNSLALAAKLDTSHKELLSALSAQAETFERRIDQLESNLARLDERTKL